MSSITGPNPELIAVLADKQLTPGTVKKAGIIESSVDKEPVSDTETSSPVWMDPPSSLRTPTPPVDVAGNEGGNDDEEAESVGASPGHVAAVPVVVPLATEKEEVKEEEEIGEKEEVKKEEEVDEEEKESPATAWIQTTAEVEVTLSYRVV